MKRIFVAVRIEPEKSLISMLSTFKKALKNDSMKWTEVSNIHITLVFLGDTTEKRVKEIDVILQDLCKGYGEFELVIRGSGVFKSLKDPRVVWAGIVPNGMMNKLNKNISERLRNTGTELQERSFNPHLTLGRVKRINDHVKLEALLDEYRDKEIQRVNVSEIILYESILRPEGPLYKPLGRYSLSYLPA
jgi:RNA 2',3'-cyclic 3'-phosphodiesterase